MRKRIKEWVIILIIFAIYVSIFVTIATLDKGKKDYISKEVETYVDSIPGTVKMYTYTKEKDSKSKEGKTVYNLEVFKEDGVLEYHKLIIGKDIEKDKGTVKGVKYREEK